MKILIKVPNLMNPNKKACLRSACYCIEKETRDVMIAKSKEAKLQTTIFDLSSNEFAKSAFTLVGPDDAG